MHAHKIEYKANISFDWAKKRTISSLIIYAHKIEYKANVSFNWVKKWNISIVVLYAHRIQSFIGTSSLCLRKIRGDVAMVT